MPPLARGAALVDPSGGLVTADAGFLRTLGLPADGGAAAALRARAEGEPALRQLLRGEGPDRLALAGAAGEPLTLERLAAPQGLLLLLRAQGDLELLEHAGRSRGLALLAEGLAHDVNGPLNTMTLQLALLADKLGAGPTGPQATSRLKVLGDQVARVHGLVRRFHEVLEPTAGPGGLDLGALVAEAAALFVHDLHQRGIRLSVDVPASPVCTGAAAARVARLVLGLIDEAVATTPPGGALSLRVAAAEGRASLVLLHPPAAAAPRLGYDSGVAAEAAAALGGRLGRDGEDGQARVTLQLPGGPQ